MRLNKVAIFIAQLFMMANTAFAERRVVFMEFHRIINPRENMKVDRAQMRLAIEAGYTSSTFQF